MKRRKITVHQQNAVFEMKVKKTGMTLLRCDAYLLLLNQLLSCHGWANLDFDSIDLYVNGQLQAPPISEEDV